MKYVVGENVCISVDAMINEGADMDFVDIVTDHDGEETFYMLYNEFGELCCSAGRLCCAEAQWQYAACSTEMFYEHYDITEQ